jgi:ABC-2 type transport system ATP-binding protein
VTRVAAEEVQGLPPSVDGDDAPPPAISITGLCRRFGSTQALDGVSMQVPAGQVHALLGPNGAGKTTLLRILTGLVEPDSGTVALGGVPSSPVARRSRRLFGLVPSGDRTFYLRISGLENLSFFGRLYGLSRRQAVERAWECVRAVGLAEAARARVGVYSHGMQKRLSVARALLMDPPILLVDEATHDLDPEGALTIRRLVADAARRGTAVVWTTQRVDEIRAFADRVTLLHRGAVRFCGPVPELMALASPRRYLVQLEDDRGPGDQLLERATASLTGVATISPDGDPGSHHFLIDLGEHSVLGDALASLAGSGIRVLRCREERSAIEEAFLRLTQSVE